MYALATKVLFGVAILILAGDGILAQAPIQSGKDKYRIGYQDRITIQVYRHPDLTQTVDVNSNGTISLFRLAEPVVALCKTESELASDIADAYRKDYLRNPEVNVVIAEQRSQSFAVIGAVEKPANYVISRKIRLLELLAYAGGPSREAGSRLIVARTGSSSVCRPNDEPALIQEDYIAYKLKDVLQGEVNPEMHPGDIVSVLESDSIYVYGNVNRQGQIKFKEPITLMQAISSAEGLRPSARKEKIRVFRQRPDSIERDEFVYDLNRIAKRETPDPFLEPNDVVAVSEDQAKSIFQSVSRALTGGLPSLFYRIP